MPQMHLAKTAALVREQTEGEMKGTTATPEDRQRMLQVLQRMQDSGSQSSSDSEDSSETGLAQDAEHLLRSLELQVSLQAWRCQSCGVVFWAWTTGRHRSGKPVATSCLRAALLHQAYACALSRGIV